MKAPNKTAAIYPWDTDPTQACLGTTRTRVAEVMTADVVPARVFIPAAGSMAKVRRISEHLVRYEKRGSVGIINARVENVGEVYDEIDSLLNRIERDPDVRVVAIYTLSGLFGLLPLR